MRNEYKLHGQGTEVVFDSFVGTVSSYVGNFAHDLHHGFGTNKGGLGHTGAIRYICTQNYTHEVF